MDSLLIQLSVTCPLIALLNKVEKKNCDVMFMLRFWNGLNFQVHKDFWIMGFANMNLSLNPPAILKPFLCGTVSTSSSNFESNFQPSPSFPLLLYLLQTTSNTCINFYFIMSQKCSHFHHSIGGLTLPQDIDATSDCHFIYCHLSNCHS